MFAADAELDAGAGRPTALGRQFDELTHALHIDADERIAGEDALVDILGQEAAGVVTADADRRLGEVVGAEEKNSPTSAISPAFSAARGSSIIVPTR